jgi:hypothetical protein
MNVTLKKIKFAEHLSEETNAFTADLYINGKNVGYVKNDGQGGPTCIYPNNQETRKVVDEAEAYFNSLPKKTVTFGSSTFDIQPSLEGEVDEFFEAHLQAKDEIKFKKKMEKDMLKGLVVGDEKSYSIISWTGYTIATLLMHPKGKRTLQDAIAKVSKEGRKILNTNLPKEFLEVV